ncbi:MAG TPA: GNAT family N-acetyltransferase [Cyclobacteriaceae bacterium]
MSVGIISGREKQLELNIKEVTSSEELQDFINFPYHLFRRNPYYVPPLKADQKTTLQKDKNPAFDHCVSKYWLAYNGEKIVGRIAGIVNHAFNTKWNKKYTRFGWFDFEEDERIANSLLMAVEQWAEEQGMDAVHGPMGFTNLDPAGMLVNGFDQVATLATLYNYPYYVEYIESAGYQKEVDWVEYKISLENKVPKKLEQVARIVKRRHKVTLINPKKPQDLERYAHELFELMNNCYGNLHGMVALTKRQIQYYIKRYLPLIRKEYISLVVDQKGVLIAFGIAMPSLSKALQKAKGSLFPFGFIHVFMDMRNTTVGELCLIAVRPDYQGKGINALLMEEANKAYIRNKIFTVESNPELEDNKRIRSLWSYYKAEQHKRRRCYIKLL